MVASHFDFGAVNEQGGYTAGFGFGFGSLVGLISGLIGGQIHQESINIPIYQLR